MAVPAAWCGWRVLLVFGPLPGFLVAAGLLSLTIPILRTCLIVTDEGLSDRRALRTVRVPWQEVTGFRVARPGWLWGGFCVIATRRDGQDVELLSTRAYFWVPSSQHLDELHRMCWTLEERLAARTGNSGPPGAGS